jgi:hypothetical protein
MPKGRHALKAWIVVAGITDGPLFRRVRGPKVCAMRLNPRSVAGAVADLRAAGYQTEMFDLQDLVHQDETLFGARWRADGHRRNLQGQPRNRARGS